jgi:hypothetical protein
MSATKKKLFAVATLSTDASGSGAYHLRATLVLETTKTAAIKLAVKGVPRRFRDHECQVVEATPEFLRTLNSHPSIKRHRK